MSASITNLPTELVELIAADLDLQDLYSLRLAHPLLFPTKTIDAFHAKHEWNAIAYSRESINNVIHNWPNEDHSDGQPICNERTDPKDSRPRFVRWHDSLCEIAKHPFYSAWITSVWITIRPASYDEPYDRWSFRANGLGRAISTLQNLVTLWLGWNRGFAYQPIRQDSSSEAMNEALADLVLTPDTPPVRHLVFSGFDTASDYLTAVIRKFYSTLREVAFMVVVLPEYRTWKHVFKAFQSCELEYLHFLTDEYTFSLRGDNKYGIDLDFLDWDQCPLSRTERFTAVGQDACTNALDWLVKSNVMRLICQNGRCEPGSGTQTIECEVFEDLDVELAYHQRYRAALKSGVTLPGEQSYHWWYQAKYDDAVRAGWFWQIEAGEIAEVEKLTEREMSFGRYRDGHPDSPLADLSLPGRYDFGEN